MRNVIANAKGACYELCVVVAISLVLGVFLSACSGEGGNFTNPNDEELAALDRNKGVAAEGTAEDHVLFYRVGIGKETVTTDLAEELAFITVVLVKVDHGSAASGTADIFRNVTGLTALDRLKIIAILPAVVLQKVLPIPVLWSGSHVTKDWRFVHSVFLILRRVGIIEGPLSEWDISADKRDQPAVLLIK